MRDKGREEEEEEDERGGGGGGAVFGELDLSKVPSRGKTEAYGQLFDESSDESEGTRSESPHPQEAQKLRSSIPQDSDRDLSAREEGFSTAMKEKLAGKEKKRGREAYGELFGEEEEEDSDASR